MFNRYFSIPWTVFYNPDNYFQEIKYTVEKLPFPENYNSGITNAPFERMAIAYGLAIPKPQLEDYKLPAECPDHTPPSPKVYEFDPDEHYT